MDFGGLRDIKRQLEEAWDHKLLLASDDPLLDMFRELEKHNGAKLTVMDVSKGHGPGIEGSCRWFYDTFNPQIEAMTDGRVSIVKVQVFEHENNSAILDMMAHDHDHAGLNLQMLRMVGSACTTPSTTSPVTLSPAPKVEQPQVVTHHFTGRIEISRTMGSMTRALLVNDICGIRITHDLRLGRDFTTGYDDYIQRHPRATVSGVGKMEKDRLGEYVTTVTHIQVNKLPLLERLFRT